MTYRQPKHFVKTPPAWFWTSIFLFSISGTFYLGLHPELIGQWWGYLVGFNVAFSLIAAYYIYTDVNRLKQDIGHDIVGSKFTWTFIKIVPILVIVPVLSFYMFSFQTIQDNVADSEKTFDMFSKNFIQQVDGLYEGVQAVRNERYTQQTERLLTLITSFGDFKKDAENYQASMQIFLEGLIDKGWACQITLLDEAENVIAKTAEVSNCLAVEDQPLPGTQPRTINEDSSTNVIQVKMSTRYLTRSADKNFFVVDAVYAADPGLLGFLSQVEAFTQRTKNIEFDLNTSITQKRFMIDFSSTVLLAVLSALMLVFRMIEKLMKPLNNLSLATREIAKGNYDVRIEQTKDSEDVKLLIDQFNIMSSQIKTSKEGLDTHNLYLETILKYSYGVIALDQHKNIRLINPVIGKMFDIKDEQSFVGGSCAQISKQHNQLSPLFSLTSSNFKTHESEWNAELELSLVDRHLLLSCQGSVLESHGKTLGYVIIVKDISKLHRAQKKAAWGEVAVRMAHEIKNPLTPILLSAQRLRNRFMDSLQDQDLEVIDKTTNTIIDQVKSMDLMVSAFADYANTPQIERKLTNLNTIINQSIALYDEQDGLMIGFDLSNDMPDMLLDSSSLSRVLINLVKNSAESTADRAVTVNIATQYMSDKHLVQLTITDDGEGFNEEVLDKVFEPYVTTKVKGSGLGMAIVQNIIEQHDGRIYASNVEPHGAKITIEFDYQP
ncbi:MAG: ATP-binding protein [Candidatus Thioglobus sp.]|uniref:sensor histidine kinase n=1 Tax=Candidatus Thioglobus sp. TaxID=2026721 RepID=UPI00261F3AF0|nr:ATP-binding protein [Candidatus Thioglobus sp.]MDC9726480.1 ATP-binding protein [Candidatus Thioglobus sp.]